MSGLWVGVVALLPALTGPRPRRRRELELGERRSEVEPRPADHDRRPPAGEDLVDRGVGQRRVLADGGLVVEGPDGDEPGRRLIRQDRQALVRLHCISRYELAVHPLGHRGGDPRFAARGRAEDADNRHQCILARVLSW